MVPKNNRSMRGWRGVACLSGLLSLACGGTDHGRPIGDSDLVSGDAKLSDCKLEASLSRVYLDDGQFEFQTAKGWSTSTETSPLTPTTPRPILECPVSSQWDCCMQQSDALWKQDPSALSADQKVQVAAERKLNASYRCAPATEPTFAVLGATVITQPVDVAKTCKKDEPLGRAVHIRGAQFSDWGAQIYAQYSTGKDVSAYDGIAFWIRLGGDAADHQKQPVGRSVYLAFDDEFTKEDQEAFEIKTDPDTGEYLTTTDENGHLVPDYALEPITGDRIPVMLPRDASGVERRAAYCSDVGVDTLKCDRFGIGIGMEPEWRFVKVPFSSLRQRGYGVRSPIGRLRTDALLGISFYVDFGNWDFWFDDIAFYKEASQATTP